GYNIDYIDAATINKLGVIPYPVLILPPTDRIPLGTYKKIEGYAAGTGKVLPAAPRKSAQSRLKAARAGRRRDAAPDPNCPAPKKTGNRPMKTISLKHLRKPI
ncbi:MAG: hypothetical protein ABSE73_30935, partial [Planctomycetota bacterium]